MAVEVADVVVVGGGGAGLAAAMAAATRGVRVVLLEKGSTLGGTTAFSIGSFSAAGTRLQRKVGIEDAAEAFFEDMRAFGPELLPRDNVTLRHMLSVEAAPTLDWLEELGVVFADPIPEPPNRVPRMHNVVPGSPAYIRVLERAVRRAGVVVHCDARMNDLVSDEQGRIVGVEYFRHGEPGRVMARRGVVLASGDFSGNDELKRKHLKPAAVSAIPIRPPSTGDGHLAAERIGGVLCNMDLCLGPYLRFPRAPSEGWIAKLPDWHIIARIGALMFSHAPKALLRPMIKSLLLAHMSPADHMFRKGALLVDLEGNAVATESPAASLAMAPKATGYVVLDQAAADVFTKYPNYISTAPGIAYAYFQDYLAGRPDLVTAADSIEALAAKIGLPAERLAATAKQLSGGKCYAIGPVSAMVNVTEGGLAVDISCRVLNRDGAPIPGLYAAGGTGSGGLWLKGHGTHLAWAFTSGRIAGETASRETPGAATTESQSINLQQSEKKSHA